ncbi:Protein of unknown function, partial [Cotesia congregata]
MLFDNTVLPEEKLKIAKKIKSIVAVKKSNEQYSVPYKTITSLSEENPSDFATPNSLKVVNNTAERGVALTRRFSEAFTSNEDERQKVFQTDSITVRNINYVDLRDAFTLLSNTAAATQAGLVHVWTPVIFFEQGNNKPFISRPDLQGEIEFYGGSYGTFINNTKRHLLIIPEHR